MINIISLNRVLKRVPLDFTWPLKKIWEGYLNPYLGYGVECKFCEGRCYSPLAKQLKEQWWGNSAFKPEDRGSRPFLATDTVIGELQRKSFPGTSGLSAESIRQDAVLLANRLNGKWRHHLNAADVLVLAEGGRLMDFTHTWSIEHGAQKKEPPYVPTPEEVNRWSLVGFGHDALSEYLVVKAECERRGKVYECVHCGGIGKQWNPPEMGKKAEEWHATEPPTGNGYQLWETTSEGSPMTPVFTTVEELAKWLSVNEAKLPGEGATDYERWLALIKYLAKQENDLEMDS